MLLIAELIKRFSCWVWVWFFYYFTCLGIEPQMYPRICMEHPFVNLLECFVIVFPNRIAADAAEYPSPFKNITIVVIIKNIQYYILS